MSNQQGIPKPEAGEFCPTEVTVAAIGGRWKVVILWHLFGGGGFSELRRKVAGISQKMLTEQLRELERHGLVSRTVYAEVPPRVEYAVTPLGESLRPVLTAMADWGSAHGEKIAKLSRGVSRNGAGRLRREQERRETLPPLTNGE